MPSCAMVHCKRNAHVQKQLRHSRPNPTLENYVKEIPESVYRMVDAMYDEITPEVKLLGRANNVLGRAVPTRGIQ
jgi:hypothetical protein